MQWKLGLRIFSLAREKKKKKEGKWSEKSKE